MLLNESKQNKKKEILGIILWVVFCVVLTVILGKMFADYYYKHYTPSSDVYYQKMISSAKTANEVAVTDVFDFEFDKAYVACEVYGDQEYFLEVLDLDKKVYIRTFESENKNRIFFVKDNKLVYDFIYERYKLNINETGVWISPDAILEIDLVEDSSLEEDILYINIK